MDAEVSLDLPATWARTRDDAGALVLVLQDDGGHSVSLEPKGDLDEVIQAGELVLEQLDAYLALLRTRRGDRKPLGREILIETDGGQARVLLTAETAGERADTLDRLAATLLSHADALRGRP